MKKILVVLTGGTIGSLVQGSNVDVTNVSAYRLISLYQEQYGREDEFEVIQPFSVLSENMTPKTWGKLCNVMKNISYDEYKGIIITHGSDTLAYTAAFIGMLIGNVKVPVILTAADYPLEDARSNGIANFRSAVGLIGTDIAGGVFVVYRNEKKEMAVYLATRLTEAEPYTDQFRGFGGIAFGRMEAGRFIPCTDRINPTMKEMAQTGSILKEREFSFDKKVLMIRPYPGLDYRFISLEEKPAAVLHYLYHSATACTVDEEHSLICFLERCRRKGIPVYTASYKTTEGRFYVTAREIMEKGAIPLKNISPEAAYAKLMLLYNTEGMEEREIEQLARETLYFECLPENK